MIDQRIYRDIAQILVDELGFIEQEISLSARVFQSADSVNMAVWRGRFMDSKNGVALSNKASLGLLRLIVELNKYYKAESMGKWNLMLYKLAPLGKSFSIDFEFNEEIESGKLTLYRYRKRFEPP
ncbi:hypothetical protein, partial [Teredinibacter turnerae]|uniref:hypothetical protein n=1 Tax=Teredinibacter turnerae TaxID=2426 RepID=UPI0005669D38